MVPAKCLEATIRITWLAGTGSTLSLMDAMNKATQKIISYDKDKKFTNRLREDKLDLDGFAIQVKRPKRVIRKISKYSLFVDFETGELTENEYSIED